VAQVNRSFVTQSWFHSHEEDQGDEQVFRPSSWPFPPSRGRTGFDLLPDGTMRSAGPGRDDRPGSAEGTWDLQQNLLRLADSRQGSQVFVLLSVASDRLILKKPA
jgi:hypothetical protein